MPKMNAQDRTTHEMMPKKGEYGYPEPMYDCEGDEKKQKMAEKGEFGTKEQLNQAMEKLREKYPCQHMTHRTNSTVR